MSLGGVDEEDGLVEAMQEKCWGDLHARGCEQCKNALGHMRVHTHGKNNTHSVLSADLSGPHPNAVGT
eukprot:800909-Prorocentrum_lima.AAC.1